jgi:CubicO group peptidase (beta-lactamase class C family)
MEDPGGLGLCEAGGGEPVDGDSVFAIASNTKAFTATALGLLVQEGRLSWDDKVTKHLPDFQLADPYVTSEVMVRDLLSHRIGLPTKGGDLVAWGSRYGRDEVVRRARYLPLSFGFRAGYGYSNTMFVAAGQIVPAVTGLSWDDFVKERIFAPLGMGRSSTSIGSLEGASNVAKPHEVRGRRLRSVPYRDRDNAAPAVSINSTARDMAQWLRLQLNKGALGKQRIVDEAVIDEMRMPHTPIRILPSVLKMVPSRHFAAYGLGWFLEDYQGRLLVRHGGAVDGMISRVGLVPEERLGIVVLTNQDPNDLVTALFYHIVDSYMGLPSRDWHRLIFDQSKEEAAQLAGQERQIQRARAKGTRPTLPLPDYAGVYGNQVYGDASVSVQDGRLVVQLSAHPNIRGTLEHWHYDIFMCNWSDVVFDRSLVPFILDGQGHVAEFKLKVREDFLDPLEYVFQKGRGDASR